MKKKLIGILVCTLLIVTTVLPVTGTKSSLNERKNNLPKLKNDVLLAPDIPERGTVPVLSQPPGFYDTTEYMIGTVAVGIIFLQNDGLGADPVTETWTGAEETQVVNEIQQGLNWWISQTPPTAGVSFTYDIRYKVPVSYEPIIHPSVFTTNAWEQLWVSQAMANLGYSSGSWMDRTRSYINALRASKGTDWAYAIYVVDSSNDADGSFSDGFNAYAYLLGPFTVLTYDNGLWGIGRMDQVLAHETGHIFSATDEYNGITEWSGYLNRPDVEGSGCLMDTAALILSSGTKLQVGWRDTDSDNILDIVDTDPSTSLNAYTPDPTTDTTPTYTGSATVVPYPNNNPSGYGNSVTINTISNVQYRVDGGFWIGATASDGAFNGPIESFTFTTATLSAGVHTIDAVATNSVGNVDPTPASDTLTIIVNNPPNTPSSPSPSDLATGQSINVNLGWNGGDPDSGQMVTYTVLFDPSYPPITPCLVAIAKSSSTIAITYSNSNLPPLSFNTQYYWQIVATDDFSPSASATGPIWSFTTQTQPNTPPTQPTTPTGPTSCNVNTPYPYSTSANDQDLGDKLRYGWDWTGDGVVDKWDDNNGNYYTPGTQVTTQITWTAKQTTYSLKVIAEDLNGAQSPWSLPLSVTTPKNKPINTPFLQFLESHPILYQLLQRFLNL